jgi:hypothetical protein
MRLTIALGAAALIHASVARAQGQPFEGVITLSSPGMTGGMKLFYKGTRARMERGGLGTFLIDAEGRLVRLVDARRQYFVMANRNRVPQRSPKFEATGKVETIAGLSCADYRVHDPGGLQDGDEACVTSALGFIGLTPGGPIGDLNARAVQQQFPKGFYVLKTVTRKGTVSQVISIERKPLPDNLFAPPAGYTEMQIPDGGAALGPR